MRSMREDQSFAPDCQGLRRDVSTDEMEHDCGYMEGKG